MTLRAWRVWGILAILVGATGAQAKPPESPIKPTIDGTATPILTQTYYQSEPGPSPRLLPTPVITTGGFPIPIKWYANVIGLQQPRITTPDLDIPIRATSFGKRGNPKAWTAFEIAEMHYKAGDSDEANRWYEEVIRQAPESRHADVATDRLKR